MDIVAGSGPNSLGKDAIGMIDVGQDEGRDVGSFVGQLIIHPYTQIDGIGSWVSRSHTDSHLTVFQQGSRIAKGAITIGGVPDRFLKTGKYTIRPSGRSETWIQKHDSKNDYDETA